MRLISHCLTAVIQLSGILSLIDFGNLSAPPSFSALPPVIIHNASPKAISGRTSYLRVRLEFLRYPHLIRHHFNGGRFGPPWDFTPTSTWTWIGHPVSGPMQATDRPIQTRFPFGFAPEVLNLAPYIRSPDRSTKSTISHFDVLYVLVSTGFQVLFSLPSRGSFHRSFTVLYAIGHWVVFRLGGWSPRLPTGFLVSRGTLDPVGSLDLSSTRLSRSPVCFPTHFD